LPGQGSRLSSAVPGARIGARSTINVADRILRYRVGAALGVISLIYGVGEVLASIK
jgi:hypothetical protein